VVVLIPAALPSSPGPYAALMAVGFLVGIAGHVMRSRTLILIGILIIGMISAIFAFVVGKLA
jgi:hypothetical protein